jgi:hypothetical protein
MGNDKKSPKTNKAMLCHRLLGKPLLAHIQPDLAHTLNIVSNSCMSMTLG